jgi:hypothetical protein
LRQATNRGVAMRALEIQFHPERVRISAEEILADLQYPVATKRPADGRKRARRRRGRG